ncbi:hypothetical protein [Haloarchaeobius amylolyticus]|uniref:hypothetical protein n=1 Tax=Haloarchaeobius amylolyticus TaxID=1198296 RepID=UPI002270466D|nr:hypothetical protein [Haloarchaeobius amylolyticus]
MSVGHAWRVDGSPLAQAVAGVVRLVLAALLVGFALTSDSLHDYPHYAALILFHPYIVRQALGVELAPFHVVWVSIALFLHPLGGIFGLYDTVWWWDHLTHLASATLVAGPTYLLARAYYLNGETPFVPGWTVPAAVLTTTLALGLVWEGIELVHPWLVVYSDEDTAYDAVFNVLGALATIAAAPRLLGGLVAQTLPVWPAGRDGGGDDSSDGEDGDHHPEFETVGD